MPARSVCLTSTVLDPCTSWASVGALVLQLLPPSSEYSTVAPLSMPVSVSEGSLVTWSLPDEPVSLESATVGVEGAVTSIVTLRGVESALVPLPSVAVAVRE